MNYKRLDKEANIAMHQGVFRKRIGIFEGMALIVAGTLGAGILGLPNAISKVGSLIGIAYIIVLGFLMIGFNLLLGEIAVRTKGEIQLVGLAGKYLGPAGKWLMTLLVYLVSFGILTVYIIGEGQSLSALLGGDNFIWSVIFWGLAAFFVYIGMRIVKIVDFVLSLFIFFVVAIISLACVPHIQIVNLAYSEPLNFLIPFGVILFAFAGGGSVLEAHSLLAGDKKNFKRSIIFAGLILIVAYCVFAFVALGVTGRETTEIAIAGLSGKIGPIMLFFGNIFAALIMGTCFLTHGLQFRHSLSWDYKFPRWAATAIACGIPLLLFIAGLRSFILVIDIVGGVFLTAEMLLIILIYRQAKRKGDLPADGYGLRFVMPIIVLLIAALFAGGVYSVVKLF